MIETLLHRAFCARFPAALNAIGAAREVFTELATELRPAGGPPDRP